MKNAALDSKISPGLNFQLEKEKLDNLEIFCPVCKNKNARDAITCRYCGASLSEYHENADATTQHTDRPTITPVKIGEIPLEKLTPADGIAIYITGTTKPVFLCSEREFVVGRSVGDEDSEIILDLSQYDGFKMGISRRHAVIRQTRTGYEIIDLSSTNGTWLNDEWLIPDRPYPMASGSQLRMGRMRFLVLYQSTP